MVTSIQVAINDSAMTVDCKHCYHRHDEWKAVVGVGEQQRQHESIPLPPLARHVELLSAR
ncbi:hypothetical protein [Burkholderia catarinensis]|uniref:hypothetical protein n=1 Tax=Burkholderia catarinensis TaxID=1108140 RepID=UPI0010085E4E|nr:hypothetical protein [Burkholderia catarinensis]